MKRLFWFVGVGLFLAASGGSLAAGEIGWIESFALATDRGVPLKQLIPGTEDYYYYHCLHYQNTEQWDKVDELLKPWIQRYNRTPRVIEIENRQALLTYQQNPQRTLRLITERLNLRFNYQREELNKKPNFPTKLDPKALAPERLTREAFDRFPNTLQGFSDRALDWLVSADLNAEQRRQLVSRLQRPDHPGLAKLIAADLNYQYSGGFGQFEIHRRLLLEQLDELLKLKPDLRNQGNFVNVYLTRLRPSDDVNWRQDREALRAYLERQWEFVKTLDPAHNSLKAHVLYQWLLLDQRQGKYDRQRFIEYLKLPRHVPYIQPLYMQDRERQQFPANLQQDFAAVTLLPPVGDDEPLVRDYLQHFFVVDADYKAFEPYISDLYLKHLFAETKIVNGLGDAEKLYSLLPPEQYQQLKERIDLDFAHTNKTELAADDPVSLDLYVKNVETLIVKVFEINAQNYYRENLREMGPDINLDGLVANQEKTYTYHEPPLRRMLRHFEFPTLSKRGVYVVDFIGNGKASRALIRKGKLRSLVRTSVAGQIFTVFDEQNQLVPDATLWLAGTLYTPGKDGTIAVPFSNQPRRQPIMLATGGFASLDAFQQESESYELAAGMYVDREELIARRRAQLIVRPRLSLNGTPVTRKPLEDVKLVIVSTDLDNVVSTKEAPGFKLFDDRETVYEFQVPQRLAKLQFVLQAKIQNQSQNKKVDLSAQHTVALNDIDRTDKTEDLHFTHVDTDYVIDVLGKTGEVEADRPVQISFTLRDYTQPASVALQSDAKGRIVLGPLAGVTSLTAELANGVKHVWLIQRDEHSYPASLNAEVGEKIELPYMGTKEKPDRSELSLVELREGQFVTDRFANLSIHEGSLQIDKLPAGDYSLLFKTTGHETRLRLTEGKVVGNYVLGKYRKLELVNPHPLQMRPVETTKDVLRLKLDHSTKFTRVHVFATRFDPAYQAYPSLAAIRAAEPMAVTSRRPDSQYVAGRNIGDEYRYIIDRKFAHKYPGNMLERPSLLLNPWAIRSTETSQQEAQGGEQFRGAAPRPDYTVAKPTYEKGAGGETSRDSFSDLDFLAVSSLVAANLEPDKDGVLEIKRGDLGPHQEVLIVAVDPQNTVSRHVTLPEVKADFLDLRLAKGLDPQKHFMQQKRITLLADKDKLVIPDITSTRFEAYDTLGKVFNLYKALNNDPHLAEFSFVTQWPSLKPAEKQDLYRKYASHELHFFLYKKDPEFFKQAIRPYLANKKEKKFLDRWLLDDDLSDYLKPWNFEQLNTFERVLLAQRIKGEAANIARLVKEQVELLPPDPDRFDHLFQTALKAGALETNDSLGLKEELGKLEEDRKLIRQEQGQERNGGTPGNGPAGQVGTLTIAGAAPSAPAPRAAAPPADGPAREKSASRDQKQLQDMAKKDSSREMDDAEFFTDETKALKKAKQYYQKLDKTMEWVESNYYKLPLEQQNAALIAANAFWRDAAGHDPTKPFLSTNAAEATHRFPEMLTALALLDLPFKAAEHKSEFKATQMTITAGGPMIVYHEEIQPATKVAEHTPILVSQNFFRQGDRYRQVGGEQVDKFLTEEFLIDVVYGCQVVVTNPTSSKKKIEVLLQIPTGALPVSNSQYTHSVHLDLEPYHTQTLEYSFYFPFAGKFAHYPVQVASGDEVLAFAAPFAFNVVKEPTNVDKESWDYISQHGSGDDVLAFLKSQNVLRVNLDRIAWRMQDKKFFDAVTALLASRHIYNNTLWSYGVKHDEPAAIRQFLQFANGFVNETGAWLDSPLLAIDPIARKNYEQMDYRPLVNARVGQLGRKREILNDRFLAQYERLLRILSYRRSLTDSELMMVTYYLLLQDRVEEALDAFGRVNADRLETRLQYDYFAAYLDFSKGEPKPAKQIAAKYADYPVERWREAFANIVNQADEIDRGTAKVADKEDRTQQQNSAATATPSLDFTIEGKQVKLNYQNLKQVQVNYYLMDIELLFSSNPFVQGESKQFSHILPNETQTVKLPAKQTNFEFALPANLANSNVLVEITGEGASQSQAYFSNALKVQMIENYGQLRVTQGKEGRPLAKVYVKVYARMQNGKVRFYKDGYTDLRGQFDYTSLNTNELDFVDKFSILILSDEHGAVVREAKPPKR